MNELKLCGIISSDPIFNHATRTTAYSSFKLSVKRLSGVEDLLDVILPADLYDERGIKPGNFVCIEGQLRSYNNKNAETNKLKINAWANEIYLCDDEYINQVELTGKLCKKPIYRQTPYGREIADLMLSVPRPNIHSANSYKSDYIPCISWGSVARMCAKLDANAQLHLVGRFQSRKYIKQTDLGIQERTAYEVSISYAESNDSIFLSQNSDD